MIDIKNLVVPFLIGGVTVSTVKFLSNIGNPALAAIAGALPIGLISIFLLTSSDSVVYSKNYFFITLILAFSIALFYMLIIHTKLPKNVALGIAVFCWISIVSMRYFITHKK